LIVIDHGADEGLALLYSFFSVLKALKLSIYHSLLLFGLQSENSLIKFVAEELKVHFRFDPNLLLNRCQALLSFCFLNLKDLGAGFETLHTVVKYAIIALNNFVFSHDFTYQILDPLLPPSQVLLRSLKLS
jgi:hypothetical protein